MVGKSKSLWVGIILIGGVVLSLPFRRSAPPENTNVDAAGGEVWLKSPSWKADLDESEAAKLTDAALQSNTLAESQIAVPQELSSDEAVANEKDLARVTPRQFDTRPENSNSTPSASLAGQLVDLPSDVVPVQREPLTENDSLPSRNVSANRPATNGFKTIQHIVRDGDTLQSLAKRYLGDARRGMEIFHANRDKLNSPQTLPIGDQLIIVVD